MPVTGKEPPIGSVYPLTDYFPVSKILYKLQLYVYLHI